VAKLVVIPGFVPDACIGIYVRVGIQCLKHLAATSSMTMAKERTSFCKAVRQASALDVMGPNAAENETQHSCYKNKNVLLFLKNLSRH